MSPSAIPPGLRPEPVNQSTQSIISGSPADALGQMTASALDHHLGSGRVDVRGRVEPDSLLDLEGAPELVRYGVLSNLYSRLVSSTLQLFDTRYSINRDEAPG